jgi:hypothetical protein
MTDVQKILVALADCYHHGQIGEEDCQGVAKALNGIPEVYHMDALKSMLGIDEEQPEEQPEDYLQVKTYTSDKFSVGDEITDGCDKYVILKVETNGVWVTGTGASQYVYAAASIAFRRTGRNFPAIAAIMEELKNP